MNQAQLQLIHRCAAHFDTIRTIRNIQSDKCILIDDNHCTAYYRNLISGFDYHLFMARVRKTMSIFKVSYKTAMSYEGHLYCFNNKQEY